jgi:hypothetical protein
MRRLCVLPEPRSQFLAENSRGIFTQDRHHLQPDEFTAVEALSERIVTRTDTSDVKDASVALLIDKAIMAEPSLGSQHIVAVPLISIALSRDSYGKNFTLLVERSKLPLDGAQPRYQHNRPGPRTQREKELTGKWPIAREDVEAPRQK